MEGQEQIGKLYHSSKVLEKATSGGDAALSVVPMDLYWIWRREGRESWPVCRRGTWFGLVWVWVSFWGEERRREVWVWVGVCVWVPVSGMGLLGGRCLLLNRVWAEYLQCSGRYSADVKYLLATNRYLWGPGAAQTRLTGYFCMAEQACVCICRGACGAVQQRHGTVRRPLP